MGSSTQQIIKIYSTTILQKRRDRERNLQYTFKLIDSDNKGYINQKDLLKLSKDVDGTEAMISEEEANAMIVATKKLVSTSTRCNNYGDDDDDYGGVSRVVGGVVGR